MRPDRSLVSRSAATVYLTWESFLKADPFNHAGVFVKYVLRPWNPVMANLELFPA